MAKNKLQNKLPIAVPADYPSPADVKEKSKYAAEDGLRALNRASEIKRDKSLMKDIKALAKNQLKAISK